MFDSTWLNMAADDDYTWTPVDVAGADLCVDRSWVLRSSQPEVCLVGRLWSSCDGSEGTFIAVFTPPSDGGQTEVEFLALPPEAPALCPDEVGERGTIFLDGDCCPDLD